MRIGNERLLKDGMLGIGGAAANGGGTEKKQCLSTDGRLLKNDRMFEITWPFLFEYVYFRVSPSMDGGKFTFK